MAEPERLRGFDFQVKEDFCGQEISKLLETLRERGATCTLVNDTGKYQVILSDGKRWAPFVRTVRDCPSVKHTGRATGLSADTIEDHKE